MNKKEGNNKNFNDFKSFIAVIVSVLLLFVFLYFLLPSTKILTANNEIKTYDYESIMNNYSNYLSTIADERKKNNESYSFEDIKQLLDFPFKVDCKIIKISDKLDVYLYDCSIDDGEEKFSLGYDFEKTYNVFSKELDLYVLKDEYNYYFSDSNDTDLLEKKYTLNCNSNCSIVNQTYNSNYIIIKDGSSYRIVDYINDITILNVRNSVIESSGIDNIYIVNKGRGEVLYDVSKLKYVSSFYDDIVGALKDGHNSNNKLDNIVIIKSNNKYGLLNVNDNKIVLKARYNSINYYHNKNNNYLVVNDNGKFYISKYNDGVISNIIGPYDNVYSCFGNGYFSVLNNNRVSIVDTSGSLIYNFDNYENNNNIFYVYNYLDTTKTIFKDNDIKDKCSIYTYDINKGSNFKKDTSCYNIK